MIEVGRGVTDNSGIAKIEVFFGSPGEFTLVAKFEGGGDGVAYKPSTSKPITVKVLPLHREWPIKPEDPFYNWGWNPIISPHGLHGTLFPSLEPVALVVVIPLYTAIVCVWSIFAYIYYLIIFKIRKGGEK